MSAQSLNPKNYGDCRDKPSDTTFLTDGISDIVGGGTENNAFGDPVPLDSEVEIPIKRVVGMGLADDSRYLFPDGRLVDPEKYVTDGVVSRFAKLRVIGSIVADTEDTPSVQLLFNGVSLGSVRVERAKGGAAVAHSTFHGKVNQCVSVPIELVRFGRRTIGQPSQPGINKVRLNRSGLGESFCDDCSTYVSAATLSFEAMAPIVLVHGIRSSAFAWGIPDPERMQQSVRPQFFTAPLLEARVPLVAAFDRKLSESVKINLSGDKQPVFRMPYGEADKVGAWLHEQLKERAKEFGATKLHVVAHSKGGLNSRYALARNNLAEPFQILSITTLQTPHEGTPFATLFTFGVVAVAAIPAPPIGIPAATVLWFHPLTAQIRDLSTEARKLANAGLPTPRDEFRDIDGRVTKVGYFTSTAVINETSSSDVTRLENVQLWEWEKISSMSAHERQKRDFWATVAHGFIKNGIRTLTLGTQNGYNDKLVPRKSAEWMSRAKLIHPSGQTSSQRLRNHSSALHSDEARDWLNRIRESWPMPQ
jgi:pimeloyl-ACP methyl ester carboxylesterase